jgi:hypothetical protein
MRDGTASANGGWLRRLVRLRACHIQNPLSFQIPIQLREYRHALPPLVRWGDWHVAGSRERDGEGGDVIVAP